jgi:hypothetical protein
MATINKYRGKFKVSIRRQFHKPIYKTFSRLQDARDWALETERKLLKGLYEDLTEANKTTLADILERYGKEKIPRYKSQEAPLYMIKKIAKHNIGQTTLTNLTTFRLIKYRDEIASTRTKIRGKKEDNSYIS